MSLKHFPTTGFHWVRLTNHTDISAVVSTEKVLIELLDAWRYIYHCGHILHRKNQYLAAQSRYEKNPFIRVCVVVEDKPACHVKDDMYPGPLHSDVHWECLAILSMMHAALLEIQNVITSYPFTNSLPQIGNDDIDINDTSGRARREKSFYWQAALHHSTSSLLHCSIKQQHTIN